MKTLEIRMSATVEVDDDYTVVPSGFSDKVCTLAVLDLIYWNRDGYNGTYKITSANLQVSQ